MATISYDKMEGSIWYNGEMLPWEDAQAHVLTHGLHYASSVFEGERVYEGEIFKLAEHTDRLINSSTRSDLNASNLSFIFFSKSKRLTATVLSLATSVFSDFESFANVLALAFASNSSPCSSLTYSCRSLRFFSIAFRFSTALVTSSRRLIFPLKINVSSSSI